MDIINGLITFLYRRPAQEHIRRLIGASQFVERPSVFYMENLLYLIWSSMAFEHNTSEPQRLLANLIVQSPSPTPRPLSVTRIDGLNSSKTTSHPRRSGNPHLQDMRDFASCLVTPGEADWDLYVDHYKGSTIRFQTDEDMARNIEHLEQRKRDKPHDVFYRAWEDRHYFMGADGTHHLAAIYRQCTEQDRDYELSARITTERLNEDVVAQVNRSYLALLATHSDLWPLHELFRKCSVHYEHVFLKQLPVGVTFLSLRDARRTGVLDVLHDNYVDSPFWLNRYLADKVRKQRLPEIARFASRTNPN